MLRQIHERDNVAVTLAPDTFLGYRRKDGQVGVRNEIWVIPTVGCVNRTAELIAQAARQETGAGVFEFKHPYACSQMGDDQEDPGRPGLPSKRRRCAGGRPGLRKQPHWRVQALPRRRGR